jgi:hypothetical protein
LPQFLPTGALRAGDSCSCVADAPHSFDNMDGKKEVLMYLVIEAS